VAVFSLQQKYRNSETIYFQLYSALNVPRIPKREFRSGVQPHKMNGIPENFKLLRTITKTTESLDVANPDLPVSGRRYVAQHYFSNIENEFDFCKITLNS
jgi:hypothetical protein